MALNSILELLALSFCWLGHRHYINLVPDCIDIQIYQIRVYTNSKSKAKDIKQLKKYGVKQALKSVVKFWYKELHL